MWKLIDHLLCLSWQPFSTAWLPPEAAHIWTIVIGCESLVINSLFRVSFGTSSCTSLKDYKTLTHHQNQCSIHLEHTPLAIPFSSCKSVARIYYLYILITLLLFVFRVCTIYYLWECHPSSCIYVQVKPLYDVLRFYSPWHTLMI